MTIKRFTLLAATLTIWAEAATAQIAESSTPERNKAIVLEFCRIVFEAKTVKAE